LSCLHPVQAHQRAVSRLASSFERDHPDKSTIPRSSRLICVAGGVLRPLSVQPQSLHSRLSRVVSGSSLVTPRSLKRGAGLVGGRFERSSWGYQRLRVDWRGQQSRQGAVARARRQRMGESLKARRGLGLVSTTRARCGQVVVGLLCLDSTAFTT
jgi:hypothetical protein